MAINMDEYEENMELQRVVGLLKKKNGALPLKYVLRTSILKSLNQV